MLHDRIELDPKVCGGKAVIRGTRIPVDVLVEQLAAGETWDELLAGYPELTRDDIRAALLYASAAAANTEYRESADSNSNRKHPRPQTEPPVESIADSRTASPLSTTPAPALTRHATAELRT